MEQNYLSPKSYEILKAIALGPIDENAVPSDCLDQLEDLNLIRADQYWDFSPYSAIPENAYKPYRITEYGKGYIAAIEQSASLSDEIRRLADRAADIARSADSRADSAECMARSAESLAARAESVSRSAESLAFELKDGIVVSKEAAAAAAAEAREAKVRFWISITLSVLALIISTAGLLLK